MGADIPEGGVTLDPTTTPTTAAAMARAKIVPGRRLGPYEILAPIGSGGVGDVFAARDTRLDRRVAVKMVAAAAAGSDPELQARRFENEARAVAALSHPNILAIFDVGVFDSMP